MGRAPLLLFVLVLQAEAAQELTDDPPMPLPVWEEILRLRARLEALERQTEQSAPPAGSGSIDLSGEEAPLQAPNGGHVLARPWYQNVALSGYGSLAYFDSGGTGTTENGSFVVKEASLFLDAHLWENTFLFTEVWLARYQYGNGFFLNEAYLGFSGLGGSDAEPGLGLKVGRFEIPFGEEYLRWDANETPLVTFTAADPYGVDEGVELYGELGPVHWITALTNGATGSGADDGASKLGAAKIYDEPSPDLYWSGSVLSTGDTQRSALRLGGSTITSVGFEGPSSAGISPNDEVDTLCWELDARLASSRVARLNLQFGRAQIDDRENEFDRDLTWFVFEPGVQLRDDLELVLRWSEIGTYDDDEGYRFSGKIPADGETFGYDVSVMRRVSTGLCWSIHPHLDLKLEVGKDHFDLIDASALDANNDERLFFAIEIVGSY